MALQLSSFLLFFFVVPICSSPATSANSTFLFNGFHRSDLTLSGSASDTRTGALQLTEDIQYIQGQAFYPAILQFKSDPAAKTTQSFSTCFVFAIVSKFQQSGGHGLAFVVAPSTNFSHTNNGPFFSLFKRSENGNSTKDGMFL